MSEKSIAEVNEKLPENRVGVGADESRLSKNYSAFLPSEDVVLFLGEIRSDIYSDWQKIIQGIPGPRKENVLVVICTAGGNPHEAFRMMRLLQILYKKISVLILGGCFSAGTLFALGADVIFMSPGSNLGPLDVQLRKEDDYARISGECYRQALLDLSVVAQNIFTDLFSGFKACQNILISTQTASRAATDIVNGLLSPVTQQIEPGKLGEMMRSQDIGVSYGIRLMRRMYGEITAREIVDKLAQQYPSHGTIVDCDEAKRLGLFAQLIDLQEWHAGVFWGLEEKILGNEDIGYGQPIMKCLNSEEIIGVSSCI